jgi:hypothetical protein
VKDRVWRELIQLHAIDKEEPTGELVGRNRETSKEEGNEHYPKSFVGSWDDLIVGHPDLHLGGEGPELRNFLRSLALKVDLIHPVARPFFDMLSPVAARLAFGFPMAPKGGVVASKEIGAKELAE